MSSVTSMLLLLAGVAAICYAPTLLVFIRRKRESKRQGCCTPPSLIQRDHIFGLDYTFRLLSMPKKNSRNLSLQEQFDTYGNTFSGKHLGANLIHSIEPRNMQAVFATDFGKWGVEPVRFFAFEPFVGRGIMCSDGVSWEHSRALIKPVFSRSQISDTRLDTYAGLVRQLIELIPKDGSTVDLQPLFSRLALDSSTDFLFGQPVGALSAKPDSIDAEDFLAAYDYGQASVGRRMYLPKWDLLNRDPKFWRSCEVAREFVGAAVSRAFEYNATNTSQTIQTPQRYVLARELAKETNDRNDILNQVLNVFLPAHEAVGVALTNLFFQLARHPKVFAKLRQELVASGLREGDWTCERLKGFKYLQNVIKESARLNPSIGTVRRVALEDTILPAGGGPSGFGTAPIYVKKGDSVMFSLYALHRRKDLFGEDAKCFRPERWETLQPGPWYYLPFGRGPRICPGQQLAFTEVAFATVQILQAFSSIENRDPVWDFVEQYRITTSSKNGAKVSLAAA